MSEYEYEYEAMNEVIPGLWVGDMTAAGVARDLLDAHNIKFIISAMRGRVKVNPFVRKHQIQLDDVPDADVLKHVDATNALIEAALARGEGVLVHCQAGQSRSVTLVAAFLMYSRNLDRDAALSLIREARPIVGPNEGFMRQLEIYHQAKHKVSKKDKNIRSFYVERAVQEVLNGDGSGVTADMFARFPNTPGSSTPASPGIPHRRIRCKMCRRELAAREHMMDHGQLSPPTPATLSRAPSFGEAARGRRNSALSGLKMSKLDGEATPPGSDTERASASNSRKASLSGGLSGGLLKMTSMASAADSNADDSNESPARSSYFPANSRSPSLSSANRPALPAGFAMTALKPPEDDSALADSDDEEEEAEPVNEETPNDGNGHGDPQPAADAEEGLSTSPLPPTPILLSPSEISAQLPTSLAALRRSSLLAALKSSAPLSASRRSSQSNPQGSGTVPILLNPACSGYFIEPMSWMDQFLHEGNMAGKILCPNEKCKAKIGNYDWAGVACGCKEWVTPGFCIARSKVDETV